MILQDFRQTLRSLAKRPSSTVLAVVVFALAIGANTTVFSVLNGFFLRPLPFPDDERLVMIYDSLPRLGVENGGTSIPGYLDWRTGAPALEAAAIFSEVSRTLQLEDLPEQVSVTRASPSLLTVLGVAPALGRGLREDEALPGNERVILLSHDLWSTRFGARVDIIGEDVRLDDELFRVVGVMPERFGFPDRDVDAWVPFAYIAEQATDDRRFQGTALSIGRMRPEATLVGLDAELDAIAQANVARLPQLAQFAEATGYTVRAQPLRDYVVGDLEQRLLVLQGIVLIVLLIAGANVATLQLSRLTVRRKDLAVRAALGASKRRLASLIAIESNLLALAGACAGLAFAYGGVELVRALGLERASDGFELRIDAYAVVVALTAALVTALLSASSALFVLLRDNPARVVHESGRATSGGVAMRRWRTGLVVMQLTVGLALLTGAGLLTKTFFELQRQGPGFDAAGVWSAAIVLPETRYPSDAAREQFFVLALAELRSLPGVVAAGFTTALPFSGNNEGATLVVDGYQPVTDSLPPAAQLRSIDSGYFTALGIPVVIGRNFAPSEPERVAIVDESFARAYWPDGDAIDARVRNGDDAPDAWYRIVGVVPHVKHDSFVQDEFQHTVYWHYGQRPASAGMFVLRTDLPTESLTRAARSAIASLDPALALYDIAPMEMRVLRALGPQRSSMVLTLAFAALAVLLAVIGVYGLLAWAVAQRVGEIGVRMALGARAADILGMVMHQGGRLIAVGLVFGTAGALALGRVLSSLIPEVGAADPGVLAVAVLMLVSAASIASWLPARRAARIDPMEALRQE
jgi:predicted permease